MVHKEEHKQDISAYQSLDQQRADRTVSLDPDYLPIVTRPGVILSSMKRTRNIGGLRDATLASDGKARRDGKGKCMQIVDLQRISPQKLRSLYAGHPDNQ